MWNKVEEKLPERDGKYLTWHKTYSGFGYYKVVGFAQKLKNVDEYEFANDDNAGFYTYDSEWGYVSVFPTYWTELPEPPKE